MSMFSAGPFALLVAALSPQAAEPPAGASAAPPAEWVEGDWVTLSDDSSGRIDLDRSALRRAGDTIRVRLRGDLPAAPAGTRWGIVVLELDCRALSHRELANREYGVDGTLHRHSDEAAPAGTAPSSESARAQIAAMCQRAGWSETGAAE